MKIGLNLMTQRTSEKTIILAISTGTRYLASNDFGLTDDDLQYIPTAL